MRQERAARTRNTLVKAAALEFDRNGYEGTSLARVSRTAGISMGALTFHFASKAELAETVLTQGLTAARDAVEAVRARETPALRSVIDLTLSLARLLEEETSVRAAARLARERAMHAKDWPRQWAPLMDDLLARGRWEGLRPSTDPTTVAALADYLIAGAEARVRQSGRTPDADDEDAVAHLARIWRLILCGICDNTSVLCPEGCPEDGPDSGGPPRTGGPPVPATDSL
ncbi:TetR family transcriptional regulator [Streptomyces sp. enrichment culture]|uniref:TetR family transcriptional regulator n=1 Tax=Streptomyces sp. enrichment culture TaxID=1795815 RepID=UPI003F55D8B4